MLERVRTSSIPVLSQLYARRIIAPSVDNQAKPCFSARADLNDKISIWKGSIVALEHEAIVNAANSQLGPGGGVDGVIQDAGGSELIHDMRSLGGCNTGDAKLTKAYNDLLPIKYVIHTVGPIHYANSKDDNERLLKSCYHESLKLAAKSSIKSIAFSCISTGVYRYPLSDAANIALRTVREFLETSEGESIENVTFVPFSQANWDIYADTVHIYFPHS